MPLAKTRCFFGRTDARTHGVLKKGRLPHTKTPKGAKILTKPFKSRSSQKRPTFWTSVCFLSVTKTGDVRLWTCFWTPICFLQSNITNLVVQKSDPKKRDGRTHGRTDAHQKSEALHAKAPSGQKSLQDLSQKGAKQRWNKQRGE